MSGAICGTTDLDGRPVVFSVDPAPIGIRWCFKCRERVNFYNVVHTPLGITNYDPHVTVECVNRHVDGDLFPGCEREWVD